MLPLYLSLLLGYKKEKLPLLLGMLLIRLTQLMLEDLKLLLVGQELQLLVLQLVLVSILHLDQQLDKQQLGLLPLMSHLVSHS